MAELNEEGTMISGSGGWSAVLHQKSRGWMLWYGKQELRLPVATAGRVERVKELVDLLNKDDAHGSLITNLLCAGFDIYPYGQEKKATAKKKSAKSRAKKPDLLTKRTVGVGQSETATKRSNVVKSDSQIRDTGL